MKLNNSLMFLSSLLLFVFIGCESSDDNDDGAALIDTPTEYSFESRFSSGENSVSYSGQVVRNFCLLYTSPSPRDGLLSRMPSSA